MRWVFRVLGVLIVAIVVAVGALFLIPAERIAGIAADQLRKSTGRDVTISDGVSMTFWPVLGVSAGVLEVGNADWAKDGTMLRAQNAAIGVDASALLRGEISITNIVAESPTIRLESRKDGRVSWAFDETVEPNGTTAAADATPQAFTIQKLTVTDATLIYDAEGSDLVRYSGVDLSLDWPERLGAADVRAVIRPAGRDVVVDATIAQFGAFLDGTVQPVEIQLGVGSDRLNLTGRASSGGAVAGKLRLETGDTTAFFAGLGIPDVVLPQGLGQRVNLSLDLTVTDGINIALRNLVADLGGNTLQGAADITLAATPQINAQLNAGPLDLRSLTAGEESGDASSTSGSWPKDAIDASGLAAFNGSIALSADSIDLGALKLGATRTLLSNERSRMVFELREVQAYAGRLSGEFVMNNRNGLSVGGKLRSTGVEMQPLLSDLAGLTRFRGAGDAQVSFLGVGQNVDQIMRSLSGSGSLRVGRGAIEGIDLDALLGSFDVEGGTTVFDSLQANFTMNGGVLENSDLLMLLPNFNTSGAGQIDLGAQTLDYTVTPKALRVNGERGLAVPVRISGAWADPKIRADLQGAIDLNFKEEKDRAEQKVKDKVAEKLQEELGVVREDGQSVEDAVKDGIEDKLKKRLLGIFD